MRIINKTKLGYSNQYPNLGILEYPLEGTGTPPPIYRGSTLTQGTLTQLTPNNMKQNICELLFFYFVGVGFK